MRIQHNIAALNANRMLDTNNNKVSKNLEKLSSGYKINRAGDDAAGLAISEKMRGQIRGLDQATNNANDGISLVQTAEGALNETASILQRMKELATQSSNGTYQNDVDRENISKEVTSLKSEIDRISTSTNFNKINLLDGSLGQAGAAGTATIGGTNDLTVSGLAAGSIVKFVSVAGSDGQTAADAGAATAAWDSATNTMTVSLKYNNNSTPVSVNYDASTIQAAINSATGAGAPTNVKVKAAGTDSFATGTTAASLGNVSITAATKATVGATADSAFKIDVTKTGATGFSSITFAAAAGASSVDNTTDPTQLAISLDSTTKYSADDINSMVKAATGDDSFKFSFDGEVTGTAITAGFGASLAVTDGTGVLGGTELKLQIGANGSSDQQVSLSIGDMSSEGLGLSNVSVTTQDGAKAAIATIDDAINQVSGTRADLGALQNRLEHTVSNLGVTSENLTSAESRIRDVDMAKEMMEMTKNNVLAQAAQSMLAQANTQPQNVLKLLQ